MPSSHPTPEKQLHRRDRFRAYMQAFNPTAPAQSVIEAGLAYEDLHRSLFKSLAGRADLEPGSQQLLVGGIGSGKTTELLLAVRWLLNQGDVLPLFIDITAETDLSGLNSGSLLASFGMHLARQVDKDFKILTQKTERAKKLREIYKKIEEFAYGKEVQVLVDPNDYDHFEESDEDSQAFEDEAYYVTQKIPGKLKPPIPVLRRDIRDIREPLEEFLAPAKEIHKDVVVIFDGLDRLILPDKFWSVVQQDLRLLRQLKISVLATAPISVLYGVGVGHSVSDHFDRVHHMPVVAMSPEDGFLQSVLRKRGGYDLLADGTAESICQFSGGVLRDLISLARDAAEEAYISGHDSITSGDVEKVVRQLGTAYLRGLGPESIKILIKLEKSKSFQIDQAANVELLVTRRVLEYSSTDFRVHPALLSVLSTELKSA
jgi:hypothetical protein